MEKEKPDIGVRHRISYKGHNLYCFIGEKSASCSMLDVEKDEENDSNTIVGLDIIAELITICLENDVSKEDISSRLFSQSRSNKDLAAMLAGVLVTKRSK